MKQTNAELRLARQSAKELSQKMDALTREELAKVQAVMPKMSAIGFTFCRIGMKQNNFDGLPGLDMKTFKGRKEQGYIVKKGEKSKVFGITWITVGDDEYMYPKQYHLFHRSQVEEYK